MERSKNLKCILDSATNIFIGTSILGNNASKVTELVYVLNYLVINLKIDFAVASGGSGWVDAH
jgi:hypothetical protein